MLQRETLEAEGKCLKMKIGIALKLIPVMLFLMAAWGKPNFVWSWGMAFCLFSNNIVPIKKIMENGQKSKL